MSFHLHQPTKIIAIGYHSRVFYILYTLGTIVERFLKSPSTYQDHCSRVPCSLFQYIPWELQFERFLEKSSHLHPPTKVKAVGYYVPLFYKTEKASGQVRWSWGSGRSGCWSTEELLKPRGQFLHQHQFITKIAILVNCPMELVTFFYII